MNFIYFLLYITAFGYRITEIHFHSKEVSEIIGNIVIDVIVFDVELYTQNASEKVSVLDTIAKIEDKKPEFHKLN